MLRSLPSAAACFACATALACAQSLSFGLKAGVPVPGAVAGRFGVRSEEKRYTVGPMVEVGLPFSLAIELNALYRRTGYSSRDAAFGINYVTQVRANSWEFPILAKFYFSGRRSPVRLFLSGGYVVRSLSGVELVNHSFGTQPVTGEPIDMIFRQSNPPFLLRDNPTHGLAVGGGARLRAGPLRLAPEIRYIRWTGRPFDEQGSRGFFVQSVQNRIDFLVGVNF